MKKFVFLSVLFFSLFGAFAQSQRLFVTDIAVEAISESQIKIRWTLPQNLDTEKDVLSIAIYRTNIPVSDVSALWNEKPLALLHGFETEYIDTVSEKKEFYYTILLTKEGSDMADFVIPGANTTVWGITPLVPAEAPLLPEKTTKVEKPDPDTGLRSFPLPLLNHPGTAGSVSKEFSTNALHIPDAYVFPEETDISLLAGEEYLLTRIITEYFTQKNYEKTIQEIRSFLDIRRSDSVKNRATFYLGESYFFLGKYQEALTYFLTVKEAFPGLSDYWIQTALQNFQIPVTQ